MFKLTTSLLPPPNNHHFQNEDYRGMNSIDSDSDFEDIMTRKVNENEKIKPRLKKDFLKK